MWLRPWHLINSSTSPTAIRLDQIWPSCHGAYPVSTSRRMTAVATSKTASSSRNSVLIDFALQVAGRTAPLLGVLSIVYSRNLGCRSTASRGPPQGP